MARNIRGITIEIDGSTTKLTSALKDVNNTIKYTQSSLRDVNRLLKLDPSSTVLLQQKQKLLKSAISETKEKLDKLKDAQKQAKAQLESGDLGADKYDALQREIVETEENLKSLKKQAKETASVLGTQLQEAGKKINEVGDKVSAVGKDLTTKVTVPIVAAGGVMVSKFAEVDKTMQLTNQTMENSAEDAEKLQKAMEDAASKSIFGMSDAADATLNFARAGLDATEAADALAPAMQLAAGEGGNLDAVSAGLVATINGFGDSFDKTGKYADVFAAACNNSALDVDSLSSAMSTAAPTFSAAGYSVEDAALYMGVMANAGISAEEAATSLKTGMARLVNPTKDAKKWMEKLGIEVTNSDGSMKDSVQIQKELHDSFDGLTESEKLSAGAALFGKNQMDKWLALISTSPDEVSALDDSLRNCAGTTQEMSDAMMDGFGGSIEKLKSSLDVLMTSMGQLIAEYLQPVIDKVQEGIDAFMAMDDSQKDLIVRIAMIIAAVGPALVIIGKIIGAIGTIVSSIGSVITAATTIVTFITGTIIPVIGSLIAAMAAVAAPFLPLIAVIGGAIAVGTLLYKNWDTIKQKAGELYNTAKEKFSALKTAITDKITAAKDAVADKATAIRESISSKFGSAAETAKSKFETLKTNVSTKISSAKDAVADKATAIRESISSKFGSAAETAKSKFETIKSNITSKMSAVKDSVTNKATAIKDSITSKFGSAAETAKSKFETLKTGIVDKMTSTKDKISGLVDKIKGFFSNMKLSIPKISLPKLPHFSLTGSFSISPPSVPKLSVSWYAKAMDNGMILDRPTIFGYAGGHYLGAGEAGSETVVGTHSLLDMIRQTNGSGEAAQAINRMGAEMLDLMQRYYPQMAAAKAVIGADGVSAVNRGLQTVATAEGRYR